MQPTLRQVPPSSLHYSTRAVFNPSWPARIAAMYPPGPEPMIRTSNFSITTVAQASALAPQSCASWEARATLKIPRKFCRVLDALFHFDEECNRFFSVDCALQIGKTFLVCFAHNCHDKPAVSRDRNANVVKVILDKVVPFNATIHNRHGFERFHGRFHEE